MDRDGLIEEQIPGVKDIIRGFVGRNPNFVGVADDLESVAMVKLIETVDRFFEENRKFDAYFRNYVRISIVTGVSDFIRNNETIRTPKNKWTPCEPLRWEPLSDEEPLTENEVLNKLFNCIKDQKDAQIIKAKLDGAMTAKEVHKVTGFSVSTIHRRLRAIKKRYKHE